MHDLPKWLEEFTEYLVDWEASTPEAAGSREPSIDQKWNCGSIMCSRVPRRDQNNKDPLLKKRTGNLIPRAEHFGDLITADHQVLNEECESRKSHRYAVVQDCATQWLQACPCKTKTPQETEEKLPKCLEPETQSEGDLHGQVADIW